MLFLSVVVVVDDDDVFLIFLFLILMNITCMVGHLGGLLRILV
jgi:hypothetical protein